MTLYRFLLSVNNESFLSFTGVNEEFKRMETIESMNILCITIQITCPEDSSNDQIGFQRTFQNLDVHFV